jgi:hypothetical protein
MGKITYNAAIDHISGAVQKPRKRAGHVCGSYVVTTHRTAPSANPACNRIYMKPTDAYDRVTPVGTTEMAARTRFEAVSAQVNARLKKTSNTYAADQAAFIAQKDTKSGKVTFRSYLWKICGDAYDEALANG